MPGPVADAVAHLAADGLVRSERAAGETIYGAVDERRSQLDYHKNAVIHRYVPLALVAAALRWLGGDAPREEVRTRALWLSRLFRLEFMYRVDLPDGALFDENVARLTRRGIVRELPARLAAGPSDALDFVADLLRPYLEAYRVAAEALLAAEAAQPGAALDRRALARLFREHGRAAYAVGHISVLEAVSQATLANAAEWLAQSGAWGGAGAPRGTLDKAWREKQLPEMVHILGERARELSPDPGGRGVPAAFQRGRPSGKVRLGPLALGRLADHTASASARRMSTWQQDPASATRRSPPR